MAQRDNMPEGTDSIIEGASGASSTSPSNADVVGGSFGSGGAAGLGGSSGGGSGGYGSAGSGGTSTSGGASGAGLSSGATGGIGGANSASGLGGDTGSSSGGMGAGGSSTTAFGSGASTGADAAVGSGASGSSGMGSSGGSGLSGGVQNLKSQAADKARAAAVQGKDRATDALGNVSTLIRDAGGMIDERMGGGYGDYARKAADAVDSFTDGLRGKEVDEILNDAKNLVRKSPGVAIGIAATVGFVLVRALKAGTESTTSGGSGTGYAGANNDGTPPTVGSGGGVA